MEVEATKSKRKACPQKLSSVLQLKLCSFPVQGALIPTTALKNQDRTALLHIMTKAMKPVLMITYLGKIQRLNRPRGDWILFWFRSARKYA